MRTLYNLSGPFRKADGKWHCHVMFVGVCQHTVKGRTLKEARREAQAWVTTRERVKGKTGCGEDNHD